MELLVGGAMSRSDRRSLAYHRAVLDKLRADPERCLSRARANLEHMAGLHPHARCLFDRWRRWLELSLPELAEHVLDPGEVGCDMRQVSPFAGLLTAGERARILKRFRDEEAA